MIDYLTSARYEPMPGVYRCLTALDPSRTATADDPECIGYDKACQRGSDRNRLVRERLVGVAFVTDF